VLVPPLKGLGARAALVALQRAGLSANLSGSGVVNEQVPAAGSSAARGSSVQVRLRELGLRREPESEEAPAPRASTLAAMLPRAPHSLEIEALP
jgi:hypothetical protein